MNALKKPKNSKTKPCDQVIVMDPRYWNTRSPTVIRNSTGQNQIDRMFYCLDGNRADQPNALEIRAEPMDCQPNPKTLARPN